MSKNKNSKIKWVITVTFLAFFISFIFSFSSNTIMPKVNLFVGIIILLLFIAIGIVFDMVGVAVTSTDEEPLHAMSSKKIKGAKKAVSFKKNADKVSSFCNDVIGDICGVLSGSISASIALKITASFGISFNIQFLISALVASITVSGKAIGKTIAQKSATKIVHAVAVVLNKLHLNQK